MFQNVPKGDAIFMKRILHDWSDEHCLKLLKNCYKSIPEEGKLIVVEAILPEMPETRTVSKINSQADVLVMTQYPGGKEQTKLEFMTLATGAGFSGIRFECSYCNLWVMEFYKQLACMPMHPGNSMYLLSLLGSKFLSLCFDTYACIFIRIC